MGRKRPRSDSTIARFIRPPPLRIRTVSVHKTATGRLGQTTNFLSVAGSSSQAQLPPQPSSETVSSIQDDFQDDFHFNSETPNSISVEDPATHDEGPDPQLLDWMKNHRDSYLDELIRHDGRGGDCLCAMCGSPGLYRCKDCFGFELLCEVCLVGRHTFLPFHRVTVRARHSHLQPLFMLRSALDFSLFRRYLAQVARHQASPWSPWCPMQDPRAHHYKFHGRRYQWDPCRERPALRLLHDYRRLTHPCTASPSRTISLDTHTANKCLHLRCPQHVPSAHFTGENVGIRFLLVTCTQVRQYRRRQHKGIYINSDDGHR